MGVKFLNTDPRLIDPTPQHELVKELEMHGLHAIQDPKQFDNGWLSTLETNDA